VARHQNRQITNIAGKYPNTVANAIILDMSELE